MGKARATTKTRPELRLVTSAAVVHREHYPLLDFLRAGAAFWAFSSHTVTFRYFDRADWLRDPLRWGMNGIDMFFVLSGFLIARLILDEWNRTGALAVRRFWARRWLRTLPAYFFTLILLRAGALRDHDVPWGNFLQYVFFLQNYTDPKPGHFDWSWSLCVEEQFYLLLPLLFVGIKKLLPKVSVNQLVLGTGIVGMVVAILARLPAAFSAAGPERFVTHHYLGGLFVGVTIAALPFRKWAEGKRAAWLVAVGTALVVGCYYVREDWDELGWRIFYPMAIALSFGVVILGCLGKPFGIGGKRPVMKFFSDITYSFYLIQIPVLLWARHDLRSTSLWVVWAVSLAAAVVMRFVVEIPFLKLREKYFPPVAPPQG